MRFPRRGIRLNCARVESRREGHAMQVSIVHVHRVS